MKKKLLTIAFCALLSIGYAQQKYPTGLTLRTPGSLMDKMCKETPEFKLPTNALRAIDLPSYVDNSKNKYMPPIVSQVGGSCAFASCVGYIYTYEYNRKYDIEYKDDYNRFNYLMAYAFNNDGRDKGGFANLVFEFIKNSGCVTWGSHAPRKSIIEWMSGYDKYYDHFQHGVKSYKKINLFPYGLNANMDEDAFKTAKEYLVNHGDGSEFGGVLQFSGYADPLEASPYDGPSNTNYKAMIHHFGSDGMHSMTIVGFDDEVEYDYNRDDIITDDEKGAFICVNTWGENWGDHGRFYAPYKTFRDLKIGYGGTGNGGRLLYMVEPQEEHPQFVFKLMMKHTSRNDIEVEIGVSRNSDATNPQQVKTVSMYNHRGGDHCLIGSSTREDEIVEFGVDASALSNYVKGVDNPTFFLNIKDKKVDKAGTGEVVFCSVIDYRDPKNPVEHIATINSSNLSDTKESNITVHTVMPKLTDGINTMVKCFVDENNKVANIYFTSVEPTNAKISVSSLGDSENILEQTIEISKGTKLHKLGLEKIQSGVYILKINTDNNFICKKINL